MGEFLADAGRFFTSYNVILLLQAAGTTLALSAVGCVVGSIGGLLLALARRSRTWPMRPLRVLAALYTELFRRIPFLVTLLLVFFATQALQLDLPLFTVALISVCLIATAFLSEIVRAGLASVHRTQVEAAEVMNLSATATMVQVVLPQAWRVILPPAFSFFILFIKDTALASQIGVVELTYAGKILADKGFPAVLVFGTVLLFYFALSYPLARLGTTMERRLAPTRTQRG